MDQGSPPDHNARSNRRIGPFEIEAELGGGGMGVVYRARGPGGEPCALKVLRGARPTPELRRRFKREARIRIDHPNIVRVLTAGEDPADGSPYIALELLSGESLEQRLRRGRLSAAEVVHLGREVCRGLAAAHAEGVVHRDLKPSNLYCCADGAVKILDFGVALMLGPETRITVEGGVIGTPAYMSPEQVRGHVAVDARSDLWSLGAVLYEALSGRPPFVRETPLAVMLAVLMDEPEPLWARAPGTSPALAAIIERALAKAPDLRWGNAAELAAALEALEAASIQPAGPPSTVASPRPEVLDETLLAPAPPAPPAALSLIPPGERRIVAVLFAEGVRDLDAFSAAVQAQGGSALPLVGMRALGIFGAERWEGDEVARAATAALEARPAVDRASVASGRAGHSSGGISGEVLRAAEAGCAAALAGVAVDAASARAIEDDFALREVAPGLWEIAGRLTAVSRRLRGAARYSPLLGRDAELAQLRAGAARALEERSPVVLLVTGPPGIGKSRLRRMIEGELATLSGGEARILAARAEPLGRKAALSLIGAALRFHAQREQGGAEGEGTEGEDAPWALRAELLRLAEAAVEDRAAAAACAEAVGELLGVPMPETPALRAARADPQLMADRVRLGLLDLFEGLARLGPIALILEDLQWADPASLAFLDDLLDRLAEVPLIVLATARPELLEARPALFEGREAVRVEPRGLTSRDVAALAAAIAGRPLPEPLARAITERTAGHPLFVEQIVLELRDRGLLDADVAELPITPTVEAAVQSRLDHLPPAEKEACKRAAVFGRPFTAEEVEAMGVPGAAAVLASLGRRDLLTARARGAQGRRHHFRSALVAEVAYGMLAEEARRDLHRRAAQILCLQEDADAEEVATHFERGAAPALAAARYAAAALSAARRGDAATVLRCSERALALGAGADLGFSLHMARAEALRFLGRRDELARELARAQELAVTDADVARALTDLSIYQARAARPVEALAAAEAAIAAAVRAGDAEAITLARVSCVGVLIYAGQLQRARAAFEEAARAAPEASPWARAVLASWRAHLAGALGDLGERRDAYEEAIRLYREVGDVRRVANSEVNLADVYNRVGAYVEAEAALRQALDACRRLKLRIPEGYALANLGYALSMQGRTSDALEALGGALAIAEHAREVRLALWARYYRVRTRVGGADTAEVVDEATQVAAEAERSGHGEALLGALTVIARAWLAAGAPERALGASTQAMARLGELGGIEEGEAELFVIHARALQACGRSAEAEDVRRRGGARVQEVAGRIRDIAWRERYLGSVAANRELTAG